MHLNGNIRMMVITSVFHEWSIKRHWLSLYIVEQNNKCRIKLPMLEYFKYLVDNIDTLQCLVKLVWFYKKFMCFLWENVCWLKIFIVRCNHFNEVTCTYAILNNKIRHGFKDRLSGERKKEHKHSIIPKEVVEKNSPSCLYLHFKVTTLSI